MLPSYHEYLGWTPLVSQDSSAIAVSHDTPLCTDYFLTGRICDLPNTCCTRSQDREDESSASYITIQLTAKDQGVLALPPAGRCKMHTYRSSRTPQQGSSAAPAPELSPEEGNALMPTFCRLQREEQDTSEAVTILDPARLHLKGY